MASSGSNSLQGSNIVCVHYRVGKKIGEGSSGVIFEGINLRTSQAVAIKFEPRKSDAPQLRDECRSYRILAGCPGIPQIYHFGQEGLHNILVIDLLGPSLEDLFDMCGRKFSIKTVCMTAKQMLHRVQTIHEKSLVHRDITPDNFLIGRPGTKGATIVHVVDFGMAKQYRDPKTKQHIPYRERKSLSGTARYMSINTHLGREQSRRDDLEALGHVFMYFLRGSLPWQGLRAATNKPKYEKIGEKKQTTPIKELCEGFPEGFGIYLNYVRRLGFEETPDYDFLRELFTKVLDSMDELEDGIYDWMLLHGGKGWESTLSANYQQPPAPRRGTQPMASQQQPTPPVASSLALVQHGFNQAPLARVQRRGDSPTMNNESSTQDSPVKIDHFMSASEIIAHLRDHGCQNITSELDIPSSSQYPIANGGLGDIYLAKLRNGSPVAVKTMRLQIGPTSEGTKHLKHAARELHTWAKCEHPNVLKLLGLAVFRDQIGMVSPWMDNGSLPSYLSREPKTDRLSICIQISDGLAYLHQCGIVHGDIKGLNVLVSTEGVPVLADFGNAVRGDRTLLFTTTTANTSISHRWAAPELLQGSAHTTESDIYALGMTLLETVTGKVPYNEKSDIAIVLAVVVRKELPKRPQDVVLLKNKQGDMLWGLLVSCWSYEPNGRPNATEVVSTVGPSLAHAQANLVH